MAKKEEKTKLAVGQTFLCPTDETKIVIERLFIIPPFENIPRKFMVELKYLISKTEKPNLVMEQYFFVEQLLEKGTFIKIP
jgi:hypothetical protein